MHRTLVAAELRYASLKAGPGQKPWLFAGGAAALTVAAALGSGEASIILASPFVAALLGLITGSSIGPFRSPKKLWAVPMAVVPWGIVIEPHGAAKPVPWSAIRSVERQYIERGQDRPGRNILTIDVGEARLQGSGEEDVWHRLLPIVWRDYAREARRPVASSLDGTGSLSDGAAATFKELCERARNLLESREGAEVLTLPYADYRTARKRTAGPETKAVLRAALRSTGDAPDPAPLAAALAVELGVTDLLPDLLELVMSPSPFVAAVCKGAALRLGAAPFLPGMVREVAPFLGEGELSAIERW
jgi:hypothetical protein